MKSVAQAMTFEELPLKTRNVEHEKAIQAAQELPTMYLLWMLVKRHKTGLIASYAVTVTILYLFPFMPSLIGALL